MRWLRDVSALALCDFMVMDVGRGVVATSPMDKRSPNFRPSIDSIIRRIVEVRAKVVCPCCVGFFMSVTIAFYFA